MATRKSGVGTPSVDEFLAELQHPLLSEIQSLRALILNAAPNIGESIKWNAPSFYTSEHFATMRLNGQPSLQLILHLGAKKQVLPAGAISDPDNILKWLGPDRARVDFPGLGTVDSIRNALVDVIRQWVEQVPSTKHTG